MRYYHGFRQAIPRLALGGFILVGVIAYPPFLLAQTKPKFNLSEARKSVVYIKRITPGEEPAQGSGFIVSKDGLIYTNRHVAAPKESAAGSVILVGVPSDKDQDVLEFYKAQIAALPKDAKDLDFAVLKIAGKPGHAEFKPLPLSQVKLDLGSDVAALGYPYVQSDQPHLSFNKGSISATRVTIDGQAYYQTDAAVNPGSSGGPLLNSQGEAVGIVSLKKGDAENINFALYLNQVGPTAELARKQAVSLKPELGPVAPGKLPVSASVALKKENWDVEKGTLKQEKDHFVLDGNGGTYWITSKEPLPENFQLVMRCQIEFLEGAQFIQESQESILRMLCIRFATADTKIDIMERKGNLIQYSHALLMLWKEGDTLKVERTGNPDEAFTMTITKQGGDYTITVDKEVLLKYHDDKPLKGGQKFSIGGYLSRLYLAEVSVHKL